VPALKINPMGYQGWGEGNLGPKMFSIKEKLQARLNACG